MTWSSHAIPVADCSCSSLREVLAHHPHAQPLAIEGQKKGSRTIFGSRRLLDVGNRRGDLDGDNVAGLVWVPEFRYGLRILPKVSSRRVASHSVGAPYNSPIHISSRNKVAQLGLANTLGIRIAVATSPLHSQPVSKKGHLRNHDSDELGFEANHL